MPSLIDAVALTTRLAQEEEDNSPVLDAKSRNFDDGNLGSHDLLQSFHFYGKALDCCLGRFSGCSIVGSFD
jgi:hypothetical protein